MNTVQRSSIIIEVPRPLLGAKIATKSGLGALGSTVVPSWGSWRLPEGSWRHLGALLEALGVLKSGRVIHGGARGELKGRSAGDQAAARGGVGEGFTPLPLGLKE